MAIESGCRGPAAVEQLSPSVAYPQPLHQEAALPSPSQVTQHNRRVPVASTLT